MARINNAFKWGAFLLLMFAAGARAAPGVRGEVIEMLCVCAVIFGFLGWALTAYIHAWRLAIRDIIARRARAEPVTSAAGPPAEVMAGRCLCQQLGGRDGRCSQWVCREC